MTATAKTRNAPVRAAKSFDVRRYGRLLARTVPTVIHSEGECQRAEAEIARLLRKGEQVTPEEEQLFDLLSALVERYEDETEDFPASPPHRLLQFLLKQNDLPQTALIRIFGSSGRVSDAVNGKRGISKVQAKALGEFFKVSPELFI